MTSTTEQPHLENAITIAYAVQNLAECLEITVPEASQPKQKSFKEQVLEKLYALLMNGVGLAVNALEKAERLVNKEARESYQLDQQKLQDLIKWREEEDRQFFAAYGAVTQQEKDTCELLYRAGQSLKNLVNRRQSYVDIKYVSSVQAAREENVMQLERGILFHTPLLERILRNAVEEGVRTLEYRYGKYTVSNAFFGKIAVGWLGCLVAERISSGPVELLDSVVLKAREENILEMQEKL